MKKLEFITKNQIRKMDRQQILLLTQEEVSALPANAYKCYLVACKKFHLEPREHVRSGQNNGLLPEQLLPAHDDGGVSEIREDHLENPAAAAKAPRERVRRSARFLAQER